jgi:hypothetical protein
MQEEGRRFLQPFLWRELGFYPHNAEWVKFFYVLQKMLLSTFLPVKETVKNL